MLPSTIVLTGASRGIGAALVSALAAPDRHLILLGRDTIALDEVAARARAAGARTTPVPLDLRIEEAVSATAARLVDELPTDTTLVHGAGIWPSRRVVDAAGLEEAYVVNHRSALLLQGPLLRAGRLARILDVGAGLMALGRPHADRTPTGADFSRLRTYCTTKLYRSVAMRLTAAEHPELDVLVVHPGVVDTGLGITTGPLGAVLRLVKRRWERPETCGRRLAAILAEPPRWSPSGQADYRWEAAPADWPGVALDPRTVAAVQASRRDIG